MLRWRLLLGALLIGGLTGIVWLDATAERPGAWLLGLALTIGWAAASEFNSLLHRGGFRPLAAVACLGTLAVLGSNAVPLFLYPLPEDLPQQGLGWPLLAFGLVTMAVLMAHVRRFEKPGGSVVDAALGLFVVAYVGVLASFAVQLRVLGGPEVGIVGFVAWIAAAKLGDIGAYTVGRLFGRNKMAPKISPGKTMEGGLGAIAFACLGSWLACRYLPPALGIHLPIATGSVLLYGAVVGLTGLLGDLAESLIKRDLEVKDSSTWLPGFGGVLDLLDSLLFSAPAAYCAWLIALRFSEYI